MLLEWLGHNRGIAEAVSAAAVMKNAILTALAHAETRTGDIRGSSNTEGMTRAIVGAIEKEPENAFA
jgi:3-isopropylmalate dehydrogenase